MVAALQLEAGQRICLAAFSLDHLVIGAKGHPNFSMSAR